jgi:hypothetical protein
MEKNSQENKRCENKAARARVSETTILARGIERRRREQKYE